MKLEYTSGCTCTSLQVNEKEFNIDLIEKERFEIANKILKITNSTYVFQCVYSYWLDNNLYKEFYTNENSFEYDDEYYNRYDFKENKFENLSIEAQRRYSLWILSKSTDDWITQEIFIKYLEYEGKGGYQYTCFQCGDSVYNYKIEIK